MLLLQEILLQLEKDNLPCTVAFPNRRMPRLLEPAIMLSTEGQQIQPFCHGNLLGQSDMQPVYAVQLSETVHCEIYSPYLSGGYRCDILTDTVVYDVCALLSEGRQLFVERTPTRYDPDTDCFRSSIVIRSVSRVQCPVLRGDA